MPRYIYLVQQPDARQVSGLVEAEDSEAARTVLQAHGFLLSLEEEDLRWATLRKMFVGAPKVKDRDVHFFTRELASLLSGGIPLARALGLLKKNNAKTALWDVLCDVEAGVLRGEQLFRALGRHPSAFSPLLVAMVEMGESTGKVVTVLRQVAAYYDARMKLQGKLAGIFAYPAIVLAIAIVVVLVFSLSIIPTFAQAFVAMELELPLITRMMMDFSSFLRDYALLLALMSPGAFCLAQSYFSTEQGRERLIEAIRRIPVVGDVYEAARMERFFSLLALLISSGVSILATMDLLGKSFVDDPPYRKAIAAASESVKRGAPLSQALQNTATFPEMAADVIKLSEEAGSLSEDSAALAGYYAEKLEILIAKLMVYMEPAVVIFIGAIVGAVLFSLFLPMFKLYEVRF